ncbi:MAG TPA: hydrogenase maturation protease [Frankiaceae bacterium]|nr:hydrogenase maturation protease [Frankiaceae bacterium]
MSRTLVLGLGNSERRDDGVGLAVAARVAASAPPGVLVRAVRSPLGMLDIWEPEDTVVVVDAVHGGQPGSLHVLEVTRDPLPPQLGSGSTHAFGIAAVVELARTLHRLPRRVVLVGVTVERVDDGAELSPVVASAVDEASDVVLRAAGITEPGARPLDRRALPEPAAARQEG